MAAALLAALFAMGVFSATGVGAHGEDADTTNVECDADNTPHVDDATPAVACNATGHAAVHAGVIGGPSVSLDKGERDDTEVTMTVTFTPGGASSTANALNINIPLDGTASFENFGGTLVFEDVEATPADERNVVAMQDGKRLTEVAAGAAGAEIGIDNGTGEDDVNFVAGESITVTITGLTNPSGNGPYPVTIEEGTARGGPVTVNIAPVNLATDSTVPGKVVELNIEADLAADVRDKIVVDLKDFGVPSSIDKDNIIITEVTGTSATASTFITGSPASVSVSGSKVTLTFGDLDGTQTGEQTGLTLTRRGATAGETDRNSIITFLDAAGVSLPTKSGPFDIGVSTDVRSGTDLKAEDTAGELINRVVTERTVTVDPDDGKRGTEVTITGKGFSGPRARVMITDRDDKERTINSNVAISGGSFSLTVDTAAKDSEDDNYFGSGVSKINAMDNDDMSDLSAAEYDMTPSFAFSPENPSQRTTLTITLKDISGEPTSASFTGSNNADDIVTAAASGDTTMTKWKFTVPEKVASGENKLTVMVDGKALTATVNIAVNELTVTPTTIVPRQEISIDGSGFNTTVGSVPANPNNVIPASTEGEDGVVLTSSITIGGKMAQNTKQLVNGNGDISFNIRVPDDAQPGSRKVQVKDGGGRIGEATITISEPAITLDPAESLVGSEITVTGTGFPANDLVLIKYDNRTVDTSATSSTGTFSQTITIPSGNEPGAKVDIEAVAQVQVADPKASADAEHKLPDATITLSPAEVTAGGSLTINGASYQGFRQISLIEVGDGNTVTPVPAPSTDKWGTFSATVQVPQLTPGRYGVSVRVGNDPGVSATEFLQVVTEVVVVVTDPADVFASLTEADRLARVWYLDQDADDTWKFYDPSPVFAAFNTLTEVPREEVVVIIINEGEAIEFPAATPSTLRPGTNNRFIN